jgi:hypothetical protein
MSNFPVDDAVLTRGVESMNKYQRYICSFPKCAVMLCLNGLDTDEQNEAKAFVDAFVGKLTNRLERRVTDLDYRGSALGVHQLCRQRLNFEHHRSICRGFATEDELHLDEFCVPSTADSFPDLLVS